MHPSPTSERSVPLGICTMVGAGVLFALMGSLLRYASHVDFYTAAMFRFAVGIAVLGTAAMGNLLTLSVTRPRLLFLRGLLGGLGTVLFYMSIAKIGLARGTAIAYTYPLFASIAGAVLLKEHIRPAQWAAIAAASVGVYFMVGGRGERAAGFGGYELLALLGAMVAGVVVVIIRELRRTESAPAIFCAQCAVGFWLVLLPAQGGGASLTVTDGLLMTAAGLLAAGGQLLMTFAYRHVAVATGSLLSMLTPVLSVVIAVTVFREHLTLSAALGMALVLAACVYIVAAPGGGRS